MSIVLRLDVPALERLLAGDTAVEVSLRSGIVQEFAKRHLVAVLRDKEFKAFLDAETTIAHRGLEAMLHEHVGKIKREEANYRSWDHVVLSGTMQKRIDEEVEIRIGKIIYEAADRIFKSFETRIDRLINARLDFLTNEHVTKLVRERLAKALA